MSTLVDHAIRELAIIGEEEETVVKLVAMIEIFSSMGHSGASAEIATQMLEKLLRFKNLAPLTDNPDEWQYHDESVWGEPGGVWQNRRNGEAFSRDAGRTYWIGSEQPSGNTPYKTHIHVSSVSKVSDHVTAD